MAEVSMAEYYLFVNTNYDSSITHYKQALLAVQKSTPDYNSSFLEGKSWCNIGEAYRRAAKPNDALICLEKAHSIFLKMNHKPWLISTYVNFGKVYNDLIKDSISVVYYNKGIEMAVQESDSVRLALLQGNIGVSYVRLAKYAEAEAAYNSALAIDTQLGNVNGQIRHSNNLASLYRRQGLLRKALDTNLHALELATEINNLQQIPFIKSGIAVIYYQLGDFNEALRYNKEVLALEQELKKPYSLISCTSTMSAIYLGIGNYPLAMEYSLKSIKLIQDYGLDSTLSVYDLGNISIIYKDLGIYDLALEYGLRALKYSKLINSPEDIVKSYGQLGDLYLLTNDTTKALEYYRMGMEQATTLGLPLEVAIALGSIGKVYIESENYTQACEKFTEAWNLFEEMGYSSRLSQEYGNIAFAKLKLSLLDDALKHGTLSLNSALEHGVPKDIIFSSYVLYQVLLKKQNPIAAIEHLTRLRQIVLQSIETSFFSLSETEREPYFSSMQKYFDAYYDFGMTHHSTIPELSDTMYNMVLNAKGLSLRSTTAMRLNIINSGDSSLIANYEVLIDLKKQIANDFNSGKDTKALEEKARELEKELIKQSGVFRGFDELVQTDWKKVQMQLKEGECAIEFLNFKSLIDTTNPVIYAALLVTPTSEHPEVVKLCNEKDLEKILGVFQGNNLTFIEKVYGKKSDAKKELYETIWQPLEPYLENIKTVYYSPSGLLHKISFSSICKEQNVFLSDVYNFRQMGSTSNITLKNETSFGNMENFLLMGGVNYNSDSTQKEIWNYLPGSLTETEAINNYLLKKKFGVNYFNERNAREEIFKEKIVSSSIVHIATHGFFFPDPEQLRSEMNKQSVDENENQELKFRGDAVSTPKGTTNYANWNFINNKNPLMRSGIVLANANDVWSRDANAEGDDGVLTAQEVSTLDLRNTKLVVLSACETGLGDIKGSEGVFGLQRGFKMAGVKYIIMSLWQVPDKETSEFMILFYKNLIKEKDIPTAFNNTQKIMRKKYDPYYWGAFVLIE